MIHHKAEDSRTTMHTGTTMITTRVPKQKTTSMRLLLLVVVALAGSVSTTAFAPPAQKSSKSMVQSTAMTLISRFYKQTATKSHHKQQQQPHPQGSTTGFTRPPYVPIVNDVPTTATAVSSPTTSAPGDWLNADRRLLRQWTLQRHLATRDSMEYYQKQQKKQKQELVSDQQLQETLQEGFSEFLAETAALESSLCPLLQVPKTTTATTTDHDDDHDDTAAAVAAPLEQEQRETSTLTTSTTASSPLTETAEADNSQQVALLQQIEKLQAAVQQHKEAQKRLVLKHEQQMKQLEQKQHEEDQQHVVVGSATRVLDKNATGPDATTDNDGDDDIDDDVDHAENAALQRELQIQEFQRQFATHGLLKNAVVVVDENEGKLLAMQRELVAQKAIYSQHVQRLDAASIQTVQTLEAKLEKVSGDYQDFKVWVHQQQMARASAVTTTAATVQQPNLLPVASTDFEKQLQRAIAGKDAEHGRQMTTLHAQHSSQVNEYQSKLESIATEYQDFKLWANQQLAAEHQGAFESIDENSATSTAIAVDEDMLALELSKKAKEYSAVLTRIQQSFCTTKSGMEQAIEQDHMARVKEQVTAATKLAELQKEIVTLKEREERIRHELEVKMKRELNAKDSTYMVQIRRLDAARTRELEQLQTKLQALAAEYQDFKFWTHSQQMNARQTNEVSFGAMSDHVVSSESALRKQVDATLRAERRVKAVRQEKRVESEAQLDKLQAEFAKTLQQSEDAQVLVEESLARDKVTAAYKLEALQLRVDTSEKDKVQSFFNFQEELAASKDLYEKRMIQLHFAKDKEIQELQTQLEDTVHEGQDYKLASQQEQIVSQEATVKQQDALLQEIADLKTELQEQKESASTQDSNVSDEVKKRSRLEIELAMLKENSDAAIQHLESTLADERRASSERMLAMREQARLQVTSAKQQGEAKANRFKNDLTNLLQAVESLTVSIGEDVSLGDHALAP